MNRFPAYKSPIRLDIGSGSNPQKNCINIDNRDLGDNMVWDITKGIPFPDDSVEGIFSSHFIEHLTDAQSIEFLRECLRVLKSNHRLIVRCPHVLSPFAFYPGHLSFWNEQRTESLGRLEYPLPDFTLIENKKEGNELFFTLVKK